MYLLKALGPIYKKILRTNLGKLKCHRSASARSISCHMAPVDTQNSAIPGAITPKMGEDLSEIRSKCHAKFHADR